MPSQLKTAPNFFLSVSNSCSILVTYRVIIIPKLVLFLKDAKNLAYWKGVELCSDRPQHSYTFAMRNACQLLDIITIELLTFPRVSFEKPELLHNNTNIWYCRVTIATSNNHYYSTVVIIQTRQNITSHKVYFTMSGSYSEHRLCCWFSEKSCLLYL